MKELPFTREDEAYWVSWTHESHPYNIELTGGKYRCWFWDGTGECLIGTFDSLSATVTCCEEHCDG